MYVLDTNTLIYFFKGSGGVSTHLLTKNPTDIAIPSIVLFELEVGIAKSVSPQKTEITTPGIGFRCPDPSLWR